MQFDGDGTLTHRYLHGTGMDQLLVDEHVARVFAGVYWTLTDHQGTVRNLLTNQGVTQQHLSYDSFGRGPSGQSPLTIFGYTGREWDAETQQWYYRARYYDPWVGVFISTDPLGFGAGDGNLYRYVANNPATATDPSGKLIWLLPLVVIGWAAYEYYKASSETQASIDKTQSLEAEYRARTGNPFGSGPSSENAHDILLPAALEGGRDGAVILANNLTFGQIDSLDAHAQQLIEENGGLYVWADVAGKIAREALLTLATMGIGTAVGAGGRLALRGIGAVAPRVASGLSKAATVGRLAQPLFAANQALQVGSGLYDSYQAYKNGDTANAVLGLSRSSLNALGLFGSIRESARMFRAAAGGWKSLKAYLFSCFAAGTPLLTPEGAKPIEQFRVGDLVLSRSEFDPDGPVEAKVVEEVFVRVGKILHLHVGGQVIRTTAEHPFWVSGKGWTEARDLQAGDDLSSHDGQWTGVEEVYDTGEYETLYNLRVADFHTYFVGSEKWKVTIWAHNACTSLIGDNQALVRHAKAG